LIVSSARKKGLYILSETTPQNAFTLYRPLCVLCWTILQGFSPPRT
jgi:hypothetical protein